MDVEVPTIGVRRMLNASTLIAADIDARSRRLSVDGFSAALPPHDPQSLSAVQSALVREARERVRPLPMLILTIVGIIPCIFDDEC